ncbi:hypothetical protein [Collimonas sp.]|uniref:hypothetical protein n=1 Tax=Collimonas sp. TaxID=1963772 RepID=UPI0037C0CA97
MSVKKRLAEIFRQPFLFACGFAIKLFGFSARTGRQLPAKKIARSCQVYPMRIQRAKLRVHAPQNVNRKNVRLVRWMALAIALLVIGNRHIGEQPTTLYSENAMMKLLKRGRSASASA